MSFLSQLNWRYATKKFDTNRHVSDANLDQIVEAIRLTPTSFGMMPYHFYIVTNPEIKSQIQTIAWNQPQITTCSHLIVFAARTDLPTVTNEYFTLMSGGNAEARAGLKGYEDMVSGFANSKDEASALAWAAKQAYIAHGFALAACAELEIDSCAMEGFDPAALGDILKLPANQKAVVLLPIGYRAEGEAPRGPKVRFAREDMFTEVK
jgi:nitroreductase / dihydropteridine reductase